MPRLPLDLPPYDQDPDSRPIKLGQPDGLYVYAQDIDGTIHILPDGPHRHPKIMPDPLNMPATSQLPEDESKI